MRLPSCFRLHVGQNHTSTPRPEDRHWWAPDHLTVKSSLPLLLLYQAPDTVAVFLLPLKTPPRARPEKSVCLERSSRMYLASPGRSSGASLTVTLQGGLSRFPSEHSSSLILNKKASCYFQPLPWGAELLGCWCWRGPVIGFTLELEGICTEKPFLQPTLLMLTGHLLSSVSREDSWLGKVL